MQHRFCFEALQYHFDIIVRERRLNKLCCPADGCGFDLRSEEHTHLFKEVLSEESYHKLLEFLARDLSNIVECRHKGCEERVFVDNDDDPADLECRRGHFFCAKCDNGPHPGLTCEAQQQKIDKEKKDEEDQHNESEAWESALALGWKPCPMRCTFGGGYKAEEECDHVSCECGHEFCWACGVARAVPLAHDNRWHKRSYPYHTKLTEVTEKPKWSPNCPECKKMPSKTCCAFPPDDGYPQSYIPRRANHAKTLVKARPALASLEFQFNDLDDRKKILNFTHRPIGIHWVEDEMPITVSAVDRGSAADRAGVQKNWFLMSVGGESLMSYQYSEAVDLLQRS